MTPWDEFFEKKIKLLAKEELVVDVGGGTPFQKHMAKFKPLFEETKYITVDYSPTYSPSLVGDAHKLPLKSNITSAILCKAVLEHVYNPHLVVDELFRISKKGGNTLVYVPFLYHYHGNEIYKDYYRYTHDGLHYLFRNWKHVELQFVRGYFETLTGMLPQPIPKYLSPFSRQLDKLKSSQQVSGYYLYAVK